VNRDIVLYVEGGGEGRSRALFRRGMSAFFRQTREMARKKGVGLRIVACGGRRETYDAFVHALRADADRHNMLLVDSEGAIADGVSPWSHVRDQKSDGWKRPTDVTDAQCQLMTVCMEAWFLADPAGLEKHFGGRFDVSQLPLPDHAEGTDKEIIAIALQRAARSTRARGYHKIRDGVKLLETVNPATVRKHCKWCDRLFDTLETLLKT
jgi:hypothetical protein